MEGLSGQALVSKADIASLFVSIVFFVAVSLPVAQAHGAQLGSLPHLTGRHHYLDGQFASQSCVRLAFVDRTILHDLTRDRKVRSPSTVLLD